jgi:predicted nucleic acid-binding protein
MDYRYWDAATFLGWLSEESGKVSDCKPVIEAAEAGRVTLVTSAVTIVEVFWLKGHKKVDASAARKIKAFFRHRWIVVREVDRFIAEAAQELLWNKNVKPKDAIHLATALRQDVAFDQFDTYDGDLIKLSGTLGDPPLTIGRPNLPARLPFEDEENT